MAVPDVEEVVSDVFLAFWDNSDKVTEHKLKAYLGSIARNKAKNKLRELTIDVPFEDDFILISDSTPESSLIDTEQRAIVKKALFSLGHPDREIFLRHYYYYQGVAQIAEEMDMNVSIVKTRLARGRQKLKGTLMMEEALMEKKITDLLDCIQDDTVHLHIKYVASIEKIQEATMEIINNRNNNGVKKKVRKLSSMVAVAAVILVLLAGTALAVVGFTVYENPAAMLRAFFGENGTISSNGVVDIGERPEDFRFNLPGWERVPVDETLADELIVNYISAKTATISWDGYTLTVEANLYDSFTDSGILYYTVENPDGVIGYEIWPNGTLWFNPETISFFPRSNWHGTSYIDEAMSTAQKLYICEYYTRPEQRGN